MSSNEAKIAKQVLSRQVKEIEGLKAYGGGTSLISIYIPGQTSQLQVMKENLKKEQGSASCIKSKRVGKAVREALTKLLEKLSQYKKSNLPKNGLAIFVGTVQEGNFGKDFMMEVNPIAPVKRRSYYCGSEFDVSQLQEQCNEVNNKNSYGFIVIHGDCAHLAVLKSARFDIIG